MQHTDQPSDPETKAERLTQLAQMLCLEIAAEDLSALAKQLDLIDALEQSDLHDYPPILKMDADWYD